MKELFDNIFNQTMFDIIMEDSVLVRSEGFEILVDMATYDDMMDEMFEEIKKKLKGE